MENKSVTLAAQVLAPAVSEIRSLLEASRKNVAQQVNQELLSTYWKIGEVVVRCEQNDSIRAAYGEKTLSQLSRALTKELGKGFSRSNVYNMRQFYLSYPIFQTVSGKLSWSHYCELLSISDKEKRSFYEKEAVNSGWSVREMKRQVESSLFERLLLSRGDANKEQVLALAEKGVDYTKPEDIIKDPYVFDFLTLQADAVERDIENQLVAHITRFLLELGKGFAFLGRQYALQVNGRDYFLDLLFYHARLKCYVVIELKAGAFKPEYVGKLNFYLSAVDDLLRTEGDQPTIGLILCKDKDHLDVEYALRDIHKPMGVSSFITKDIPLDVQSQLPSVQEIEDELKALGHGGAGAVE